MRIGVDGDDHSAIVVLRSVQSWLGRRAGCFTLALILSDGHRYPGVFIKRLLSL